MSRRLARRLTQPTGRLSGDEQLDLARGKALLLDSQLLCLDELSLRLAPVVFGELLALIRGVNAVEPLSMSSSRV